MTDILGNATSVQLLILMAIPLTGVIILSSFLLVSFFRRKNKTKMKLGIQPKKSSAPQAPISDSINDLNTDILSRSPPAADSAHELNTRILTEEPSPPTASIDTSPAPTEAHLNTEHLSSQSNLETFAMDTSAQPEEERIDLAARLGNPPPPPAAQSSEPVELLRLLRHPQSGQLIVEIAGRRYAKLADIADKEIGQYILKLAAHLLAFTNGMIATEAGIKSVYTPKVDQTPKPIAAYTPPEPSASEVPEPARSEPLVPKPSPEAEAAFLASLQAQPPKPAEPPPPQRRGLFGRSSSPAEEPMLPGLNLAGEINKIVQARLMASPLAATTKIDITSDPGGGIRIDVNGTIYHSPDDVPDPEIKELIKASIKQWERS